MLIVIVLKKMLVAGRHVIMNHQSIKKKVHQEKKVHQKKKNVPIDAAE
jgi:hypothetical protein